MFYIYLILRLGLLISIAYVLLKYISIRKYESVKLAIKFFSMLEIGLLFALTIISFLTVENHAYDVFILFVIIFTSILWIINSKRIILIGEENIYINFNCIRIENLNNLHYCGWYILIDTKVESNKVYLPLTAYNELANLIRK